MKYLAVLLLLTSSLFAQRTMFYSQNKASTTSFPSTFAYVASTVTGCKLDSGGGITTCPTALHTNPTSGHLGIVQAWWADPGTTTASFSCTNNGSFTALGSKQTGTGSLAGFSGQMFYKVLTSTGADTCTMTWSAGITHGGWEYAQFSFTGSISGTDGSPAYSITAASGTTATISGVTTASSTGILFAGCMAVDSSCSAGSGFTSQNDTVACFTTNGTSCGSTGNYLTATGSLLEYKFNAASGAQSATFGTGNNNNVILGLVAF